MSVLDLKNLRIAFLRLTKNLKILKNWISQNFLDIRYLLSTFYYYNMQWLICIKNFSEYLACYTIINYLKHAHIIHELCCCLFLWIILLSSICNITKLDKTLIILSILATYNLSIQSFVTFVALIKVNIYHMYLYINSSFHIVPSSEVQYSLTLRM